MEEKRHNVKSYAICGESGNVDIDKAEEWKAFLASLCDGCTPADIIFNTANDLFKQPCLGLCILYILCTGTLVL